MSSHLAIHAGSIERLKAIRQELRTYVWPTAPADGTRRLKREELAVANSVALHERFFAALGGDGRRQPGGLSVAIDRDFGSFNRWRDEFAGLIGALNGDPGWVVLAWSSTDAQLVNYCTGDEIDSLSGAVPLLTLDLDQHAYGADYATNVDAYVDAFFRNLDWAAVSAVYCRSVEIFSHPWGLLAETSLSGTFQVFDVRRSEVFGRASDLVAGAVWHDPTIADDWSDLIDAARPVLVYCAHGHEVSRSTALSLRSRGFDAHYLIGGLEAWKTKGLPTTRVSHTPPA